MREGGLGELSGEGGVEMRGESWLGRLGLDLYVRGSFLDFLLCPTYGGL